MLRFFYIGAGGAAGSLLRYWISEEVHRFLGSGFPWGTLCINLSGSLIIGFLWALFEFFTVSHDIKLMLFIGFLGSFTTFATFSLENLNLYHDGEYAFLAVNVFASILFGLALVYAGHFTGRYLLGFIR